MKMWLAESMKLKEKGKDKAAAVLLTNGAEHYVQRVNSAVNGGTVGDLPLVVFAIETVARVYRERLSHYRGGLEMLEGLHEGLDESVRMIDLSDIANAKRRGGRK